MSIERKIAISTLKLTKTSNALIGDIKTDAKVPLSVTFNLLQKMQNEGILNLRDDCVQIDSNTRLKLAVHAAILGGDIETVSNLLCWQEFEEIAAFALKNNGYKVQNNVRFSQSGRRWEIDVVGCKKPLVVCIDCKHWAKTISPSALRKIADLQVDRTRAFADFLPTAKLKFPCITWPRAKFIPSLLSLMPSAYKFVHDVPVVPVLKLQDFIEQLPLYTHEIKFFSKSFPSLDHNL
jgi:Holliday junction resolvase-like predicted endonuclease